MTESGMCRRGPERQLPGLNGRVMNASLTQARISLDATPVTATWPE
jgi:hypothetical protein